MKAFRIISIYLLMALCANLTLAQEAQTTENTEDVQLSAEEQAYIEHLQKVMESLDPQSGEIALPGGFATLNVPESYYFLNAKDSKAVLEELWGNPPGEGTIGMLFPSVYSPLDEESWAVTLEYVDDGYVSDEDAHEMDYDELLEDMQDATREGSREREKLGYGTVELLGWAEPPHYSSSDKHMYWAKDLLFNDEQRTLNYDIRTLGRHGVLSMTFIANNEQLAEINEARDEILQMAVFNPGFRYEDFNPNTDKIAAYGVGALVAGAVAKKTGLLIGLVLLLKKFGVFIIIGIGAFWGKIKNLFGGGNTTEHS